MAATAYLGIYVWLQVVHAYASAKNIRANEKIFAELSSSLNSRSLTHSKNKIPVLNRSLHPSLALSNLLVCLFARSPARSLFCSLACVPAFSLVARLSAHLLSRATRASCNLMWVAVHSKPLEPA